MVQVWTERRIAPSPPQLTTVTPQGRGQSSDGWLVSWGYMAVSGLVLRYVAEAGGVPLVLGTFGSAAWRVPVRDARIGWSDEQRAVRLAVWRGCARTSGCACCRPRRLCRIRRRGRWLGCCAGWPGITWPRSGCGWRPWSRSPTRRPMPGRCTRCAVSPQRGPTAGDGRSRGRDHYVRHGPPKACWLRELVPGGMAALATGFDPPVLTGCRAPDFNKLDLGGEHGLPGYLDNVTGHRKPTSTRKPTRSPASSRRSKPSSTA